MSIQLLRPFKFVSSAIVCGLLVTACLTMSPQPNLDDMREAEQPLVCKGTEQCALYWRRAQIWIATYSGMKIQLATDTIIETFNPPQSSTTRAYRILRIPDASGAERITIASFCMNMFGCVVTDVEAAKQFKRYVRHGEPVTKAIG